MKNKISIFLILILYIFTFFFFDNAEFDDFIPSLNKVDFEDILTSIQTKKPREQKVSSKKVNNYEKYYPKKFSYPKSYKKGKITLFINNPLEYNSPSSYPKV